MGFARMFPVGHDTFMIKRRKPLSEETKSKLRQWAIKNRVIPPSRKGCFYNRIKKTCPVCNREFTVMAHLRRIICCSRSCGQKMNIKKHGVWNKGLLGYMAGEKHSNWRGGISFEPYGKEFNETLKEKIRRRDCYRCRECFKDQDELRYKNGKGYKLIVHHIDYNKRNNLEGNLISLCASCHGKTNFGRKDWTNYYKKAVSAWTE